MPVTPDDSCVILFSFVNQKGFVLHPEALTTTVPGGTLGVKHTATVGGHWRDFDRRNAETHFISWLNCPAAEVKCENKCLHRKAQRKRSVTLFPKQKQEQQDG